MMHKYPEALLSLITYLKKLPGVGTRTAERFAFELLRWDEEILKGFSQTLSEIRTHVPACTSCGCLTEKGYCRFCARKESTSLCLLASARDAYAIEETGSYHGLYHVIDHLLSPLDGRHAHTLKLERIEQRLAEHNIKEVIIALDSTLEGDTTALYLQKALQRPHLSISRLAFGLPVGSSLEHIDAGTLARAFSGRQPLIH